MYTLLVVLILSCFSSVARAVEVAVLQHCIDTFTNVTSLNSVCQDPESTSVLEQVVRDHFNTCFQENEVILRDLRITVPNASLLPALTRHAAMFQKKYNISVKLNVLEVTDIAREVRGEARQQLQGFSDGWIVDPSVTGDLAAANALANLTSYVFTDQELAWSDVAKFFRMISAYFNKRIVGVPLDGDLLLMYYRRDLFERYNLSIPVTWEEFVDVAQTMNGTDTDGDQVGDLWGVCLDNSPASCKSLWILTAMMAPYLQYNGTKQGVYIDPLTMKPLIDNPAMTRAVQLYSKLVALEPKPTGCPAANPNFINGSCLMTINFGDQFKVSAQTNMTNSIRRFNGSMLGVSRLPGSLEVLNRTSGAMMTCTSATCPYAQLIQLANGSRALVNFAPFSAFGGWTGMVNARTPQEYQMWAFKFFSHVSQQNNSLADVLDPTSGIDPYRTSQLQPSAENLGRWVEQGYDVDATSAYLIAMGEALDHENMVLDIRLQRVADVTRMVMGNVADNTTWLNQPIPEVLATGQYIMEFVLNSSGGNGLRDLQTQYWQLLGYSPADMKGQKLDSKGNASAGSISVIDIDIDTNGLRTKTIVELAVLIPVGAVLLATAVGLLVWRRVTGHRNLLYGSVKAPMAGPQITLLITDIQDSTLLWEVLPDTVMDSALQVHHVVVRQALSKHHGYESATEGDSFILAFHSAEDAVACAMRIQTDLLIAPWPPQLLRCTGCTSASEVWIAPARCAVHQHAALLEMLSGGSCELKAQHGRPFCIVRDCWGATIAATAAVPRPMYGRGGTSRRGFLYRSAGPTQPQSQQHPQNYPLAPNAALKSDTVAAAAAAVAAASRGKGVDAEVGFGRQDSPEGQLSSPQFGRLSTLSVLGDDDTPAAVSRNWSVSYEGLLSHGSSQYRDEPSSGTGWLSNLANVLGFGARGKAPQNSQSQLPLVSSASSPNVLSTDKTNTHKPWFGGGGGGVSGGTFAGISAPAVAAAAAAAGGVGDIGGFGFDSGRLLNEHIRSVWRVVDEGRGMTPTTDGDIPTTGRHGGGFQSARSSKDVLTPTAVCEATMAPSSLGPLPTAAHLPAVKASISAAEDGKGSHLLLPPPPPPPPPPGLSVLQVEMAEACVSSEQCKTQASMVAGPPQFARALPYNFDMSTPKALTESTIGGGGGSGGGNTHTSIADSPSARSYLQPSTPSASPPQRQSLLGQAATLPSPLRHQGLQVQTSHQPACGEGPTGRPHAVRQLLAFRGLRVRMGIHSGVPDSEHVLYNQAEARYHYTGSGMAIARAVQGAAAGGQVLLSDATFALVRDGRHGKRLRDTVLIHAGEHVLDTKLLAAQQVYQALPRQLLCRLSLQPPLKVMRTLAVGALDAPVGRVAVAFVSVVGTVTLQAWNPEVMRQALTVFRDAFSVEAAANSARRPYVVESTGGLLLAAFASAADALATCMAMQSALLLADWPPELLEHDMCEEVTIATPQIGGTIVREVLFRGLRVKAGIDCGPARAALNGTTGRIAYRGRVMNRAARINAQGSSGQVLCSRNAWQAACEAAEGGPASRGLAALSLGHVSLKGIGEPVEILEVRPLAAAPPPGPPALMGRIMLGTQPSGSLTGYATAAAMSTAISIGPASPPTLPVVMPTLATANSIHRPITAMSTRDEAAMLASGIAAATLSVALSTASVSTSAPAAIAGAAGSAPVLSAFAAVPATATATSTSNASANTVNYKFASTAHSTVQGTALFTGSLYDSGMDSTNCGDVTAALPPAIKAAVACSTGGREASDHAVVPASEMGASSLQRSGSSLFGLIRSPLSAPSAQSAQQQHQQQQQLQGQGQLAAEATGWYFRASSRRCSINTQLPIQAPDSMLQSQGTLAQMLPSPTVQIFRVDATTGIAALEIPSASFATATGTAPSPSSAGPAGPMSSLVLDAQRTSVEANETQF